MPYAILLNELIPLDLQKTARILAKAQNIIYADATRSVRNCCGILAQNLTLEEARSLSDDLNREDVGVFYMDQGQMYRPERAVHVNNADCLEQHFNVQDVYGRPHPLSWENITLISLGRVVERTESGSWACSVPGRGIVAGRVLRASILGLSGGMIARGPVESSPGRRRATEEERHILDIFSKVPQRRHYRIQQKSFNYNYLGERLRPNSTENFRLFIEDLVRFAKHAYGNRGINAYLTGKEPEKIDYYDLDHFNKENLWLLQLIHTGESSSEEDEGQ